MKTGLRNGSKGKDFVGPKTVSPAPGFPQAHPHKSVTAGLML